MRIKDCGGKYGDCLRLCHQTNSVLTKEELAKAIRPKAVHWAPRTAKSYAILSVEKYELNYTFNIAYFTTEKEGEVSFDRNEYMKGKAQ
jgi:hypothetical protein